MRPRFSLILVLPLAACDWLWGPYGSGLTDGDPTGSLTVTSTAGPTATSGTDTSEPTGPGTSSSTTSPASATSGPTGSTSDATASDATTGDATGDATTGDTTTSTSAASDSTTGGPPPVDCLLEPVFATANKSIDLCELLFDESAGEFVVVGTFFGTIMMNGVDDVGVPAVENVFVARFKPGQPPAITHHVNQMDPDKGARCTDAALAEDGSVLVVQGDYGYVHRFGPMDASVKTTGFPVAIDGSGAGAALAGYCSKEDMMTYVWAATVDTQNLALVQACTPTKGQAFGVARGPMPFFTHWLGGAYSDFTGFIAQADVVQGILNPTMLGANSLPQALLFADGALFAAGSAGETKFIALRRFDEMGNPKAMQSFSTPDFPFVHDLAAHDGQLYFTGEMDGPAFLGRVESTGLTGVKWASITGESVSVGRAVLPNACGVVLGGTNQGGTVMIEGTPVSPDDKVFLVQLPADFGT